MDYKDLDINGRINLKGEYEHFVRIAMERFQESLDKRLYKKAKVTFYKTRMGNDRWVVRQSKDLRESFQGSVKTAGAKDELTIKFLMYGRFVDMGVGRGTNTNTALYRKRYGADRSGIKRQPIRWYSKTRAREEKRLAELLAHSYAVGLVRLSESLLNNTVTIPT